MIGIVIAILLAALVYYVCIALALPSIIAIIAVILVLLVALGNFGGYVGGGPRRW